MITHDEIYEALARAFPATDERPGVPAVTLLARYEDEALELPQALAYVFIPDCHLLTPEDAGEFWKYRFKLDGDFDKFMRCAAELYRDHVKDMMFFQLGDFMDLWRTLGGLGDREEARQIAAHYTRVMTMLRQQAPEGVNATVLAGNHDFALRDHGDWMAPRYLRLGGRRHPGGKGLIVHGDCFDWLEVVLPNAVQEFFVKLVKSHKSGRKDLGKLETTIVGDVNRKLSRDPNADLFIDGEEHAGTASLERLQPKLNVTSPSAGGQAVRFWKHVLELAETSVSEDHDLRLVVVGHTHNPRIVAGKRSDGKPLVLMDCGAWVGKFRLEGETDDILKAQVGVIVGNDLRIYQVGRRVA